MGANFQERLRFGGRFVFRAVNKENSKVQTVGGGPYSTTVCIASEVAKAYRGASDVQNRVLFYARKL